MPGDTWDRIEKIFLEAADLSSSERAIFLDRACGSDGGLCAEVESLLYADDTGSAIVEAAIQSEAASCCRNLQLRIRRRRGRYLRWLPAT